MRLSISASIWIDAVDEKTGMQQGNLKKLFKHGFRLMVIHDVRMVAVNTTSSLTSAASQVKYL